MKKIEINKDICLGCGACCGIDEEHFEFGEDGFPEVKTTENATPIMEAVNEVPKTESTEQINNVVSTPTNEVVKAVPIPSSKPSILF